MMNLDLNRNRIVYMDIEEEQCKGGVYLTIYKMYCFYSKREPGGMLISWSRCSLCCAGEMVIGRKDNVNIVKLASTDYRMDTVDQIPELCDEEGNALKRTRKKEG